MSLIEESLIECWDGNKPCSKEEPCDSWKEYLELLGHAKAWGSAVEIRAMSMYFERPVMVMNRKLPNPLVVGSEYPRLEEKHHLCLRFDPDSKHYDAFTLKGGRRDTEAGKSEATKEHLMEYNAMWTRGTNWSKGEDNSMRGGGQDSANAE